jgi:flagellar biosynthesis GTPase FlhF
VAALRHDLAAAQDAAADAATARKAAEAAKDQSEQQRQRLQQQIVQLQQQDEQPQHANQQLAQQRQQLQRRLAECEQALTECERCCAAAVLRAESAEAELSGIRQDVAEWSDLHVVESCELQETRRKLAGAETDLGVALQRMAACGLQTRRSNNSSSYAARAVNPAHSAPSHSEYGRPGSACANGTAAAGNKPGSLCRRDGLRVAGSEACLGQQQQQQQLPLEVTRQLQWQASEVVRLTGQMQQLQVSLLHLAC